MTGLVLRSALPEDVERVWHWNNSPEARAVSKTTSAIAWEDHQRWFERRLADSDSPMFVIEVDALPVGVVRLEQRQGAPSRTISVVVDGAMRGRGIGVTAIREVTGRVGGSIEAWVLADNQASQKCFVAAGYRQAGARAEGGREFFIYEWEQSTCK